MTHDEAQQWAIARLKALLANKLLRLNPHEASTSCEAMSALTGKQWLVVKCEGHAQVYYRAVESEQYISNQATTNQHKSGS